MELKLKITQILQRQEGVGKNGNTWAIQPYVGETLDNYPRKVMFEIFGEDKIKQYLMLPDEVVTISFDLESREFNDRWYTSVRAWKVDYEDIELHKQRVQSMAFDASQDTDLAF